MVPPDRLLRRVVAPLFALIVLVAVGPACASSAVSGDGGAADRTGDAPIDLPVVSIGGQTGDDVPVEQRPATVAMVGDSITVASAEELGEGFADLGLEVIAIDAQIGRRMTVGERDRLFAGADIVELVSAQDRPDLWVVALGTNDIGQYGDVDEVVEQIEALMARLPADVPVVWVDTWIRDRPEQTDIVNAAIRSVIDDRPDSAVVPWSDHAPGDGVISGDGVHLSTVVGVERFTDVVTAGVESLIGPAD